MYSTLVQNYCHSGSYKLTSKDVVLDLDGSVRWNLSVLAPLALGNVGWNFMQTQITGLTRSKFSIFQLWLLLSQKLWDRGYKRNTACLLISLQHALGHSKREKFRDRSKQCPSDSFVSAFGSNSSLIPHLFIYDSLELNYFYSQYVTC